MDDDVRVWDRDKFTEIQKWAGEREGYRVDPKMIKKGFGDKAYFWDAPSKEWRLLRAGDLLYKRTDGTMFMESAHKKAGAR